MKKTGKRIMRGIRMNYIAAVLACLIMAGCAPAEIRRVWSGLDDQDMFALGRSYAQAYLATEEALYARAFAEVKAMNVSICKRRDQDRFFVAYGFNSRYAGCIDTTEVGFLVRPSKTAGASELVVASENYSLALRVGRDLFNKLAGKNP